MNLKADLAIRQFVGLWGTWIGAELLNLNKTIVSRVPVASIGGTGTFDGIFLAGIFAAVLAPFPGSHEPPFTDPFYQGDAVDGSVQFG